MGKEVYHANVSFKDTIFNLKSIIFIIIAVLFFSPWILFVFKFTLLTKIILFLLLIFIVTFLLSLTPGFKVKVDEERIYIDWGDSYTNRNIPDNSIFHIYTPYAAASKAGPWPGAKIKKDNIKSIKLIENFKLSPDLTEHEKRYLRKTDKVIEMIFKKPLSYRTNNKVVDSDINKIYMSIKDPSDFIKSVS